jgi:hypothetical protein
MGDYLDGFAAGTVSQQSDHAAQPLNLQPVQLRMQLNIKDLCQQLNRLIGRAARLAAISAKPPTSLAKRRSATHKVTASSDSRQRARC